MQAGFPGISNPGEIINERTLRDLYERFLAQIRGVHDEIEFEATRVEIRIFFRESLLCRIVPYRELFHVLIGDENPWEIRVRDEATCLSTLDRVLDKFFERFASCESSSSSAG
jgi:hypothetical protein